MKLPKSIQICGRPYKLVTNPDHDGGAFSEGTHTIEIGTLTPGRVADILLHEVMEATLAIRNLRLSVQRPQPDNGDYRFVFNHEEFEQAMSDIAISLSGINFPKIKEKK